MMTSNLAKLQQEYDRLREENLINLPAIVEYTSRRSTGGVIKYANWKHPHYHLIRISSHMSFEEQMETLRHEAAHAYCGHAAGHNAFFWRTAERFGCTRRYAPVTEETKRKREERIQRVYECPACHKRFTYRRRLTTTKYHTSCYYAGQRVPLTLVESLKEVVKYA